MREGPLSNSSNTVPWVKVPHKKTSKTNVRECLLGTLLSHVLSIALCDYLFMTWKHLRPPNVRQMLHKRELRFRTVSAGTPPGRIERELGGAKLTWQEWSKIRMYSDTATRIWSPRACRTQHISPCKKKWLETLTLCAPPPPSCCLSLSSSVFLPHTHSIPVVWQIFKTLKSTANKWWKKGEESHRWLWQWRVFSLLNLRELHTQPDSESKSIVKLEDFR